MQIQRVYAKANMKFYFATVSAACLIALAYSASAQQCTFTYAAAGNTVAIAGTGSAAPAITAPPQTRLLEPNQPVSFSVAATGLGNGYQWPRNGVPIFDVGSKAAGYISKVIEG